MPAAHAASVMAWSGRRSADASTASAATASARLSSPGGEPPFLARQERSSGRRPPRCCGPQAGAASVASGPWTAIEAAMGAGLETLKGTSPWRPSAPSRRAATATPATSPPSRSRPRASGSPPRRNRSNDNAPTHRVFVGKAEIGAAWTKRSNEGRDYLSVKLGRPELHRPDLRQPLRRRRRRHLLADLVAPQREAQRRLSPITPPRPGPPGRGRSRALTVSCED